VADPHIDYADEGMTTASILKLFSELKSQLAPMLGAICTVPCPHCHTLNRIPSERRGEGAADAASATTRCSLGVRSLLMPRTSTAMPGPPTCRCWSISGRPGAGRAEPLRLFSGTPHANSSLACV
jgi:hypothetical protein